MVQVLDQQKRDRIIAAAAALFAAQSFHQVRLDEIATHAQVGKGTLYTYFKNKENLYFSVLYEGFAELVDELQRQLAHDEKSPLETLQLIVRAFSTYALRHPHLFELTRTVGLPSNGNPNWERKRREMTELIERAIRSGITAALFEDTHPAWTAQFIPSMVRSVMLYGKPPKDPEILTTHVFNFVKAGLLRGNKT